MFSVKAVKTLLADRRFARNRRVELEDRNARDRVGPLSGHRPLEIEVAGGDLDRSGIGHDGRDRAHPACLFEKSGVLETARTVVDGDRVTIGDSKSRSW